MSSPSKPSKSGASTESSRTPRGPGKGRRKTRLLRWLVLSIIPLSILAVVGLLILTVVSYRVAARFEAREQESPTRIYGRTLSLEKRALLPADDIVARLKRLGYRQTKGDPASPGEFKPASTLTIYQRAFEAPGGTVAARRMRVHYTGRRIAWVEDARSGDAIEDARLEPEVLTTLYGAQQEDRTVLAIEEFPRQLIDAVLVTEDRHFYSHPGVDPIGMARATLANVRSGAIRQGGSTLTQQLAKNLFFEQERTFTRKLSEAGVALILERRYSKQRILQAYLNEIYLGQRGSVSIRGFAQAATFYFGKDVRFLDLSEEATLAGLIRAPGVYNPFLHPERALERRNQVLAAMEEEKKITPVQRRAAQALPLRLRKDQAAVSASSKGVSYLADYVRQMIDDDAVDFSRAGMKVFTTVDPILQRRAEEAITRGVAGLETSYRKLRRKEGLDKIQGAMVALDPQDGSVLAMVGGRDYATSQFNRITQAHRQPGSLFKPFVYLAGYEKSRSAGWVQDAFTPATQIQDEPLEMTVAGKLWAPANYDNEFRGPVTAQMALEQSLNVPTVRAAQMVGLKSVVDIATRAGVKSALKPYPSVALGAQEVTPLDIASAYATIANHGLRNEPYLVESIEDARGGVIFARKAQPAKRAVSAESAYLVTVGLQGAMDRGTAASSRTLGFTGTSAGKTGTTNEYRDTWFCGYTPDLLALVWVGFDDGDSTGLTGAQAALPVWVDFMLHSGAATEESFKEPSGIVWEQVDPLSGGVARWSCPESRWMAFLEGTEPTEKCELHGLFGGWWSRREHASDRSVE
ncbi:MAG TPA: PBP1A family penicillin-binding protein [Patescibacteria group bacterium]|nr:PBP1A family penicillin-binding protein [Patescibacteria group bacterium]